MYLAARLIIFSLTLQLPPFFGFTIDPIFKANRYQMNTRTMQFSKKEGINIQRKIGGVIFKQVGFDDGDTINSMNENYVTEI